MKCFDGGGSTAENTTKAASGSEYRCDSLGTETQSKSANVKEVVDTMNSNKRDDYVQQQGKLLIPMNLLNSTIVFLSSSKTTHLRIPSYPLPPNNPPHPNFSTSKVTETETLHPCLGFLPPLLPSSDLLLRTIPIDDNCNMCISHTHIHRV